ncbi:Ribosomal protein lysine methyltransferase [Colletotrichum fioriniae]|uniref:Ribosomal protein lysine methyltransferase n=1 Tax=Colletotrichum fioriniae TaxID=710243 RepID=UPI0032D9BAD5|nr:Ribosomal protein lysine methyltransferase [Colletotrichum fioriniae]
MAVKPLIATLEDEILDPEEGKSVHPIYNPIMRPRIPARRLTRGGIVTNVPTETFFLFSHNIPSSNLGFIDPKATELSLTLAGRDFTIHQSPTVLSSTRAGGTTGAALLLAPRVARYVLTDQPYVARMIHQNLEANPCPGSSSSSSPGTISFRPLDWELDTPDPSLTGVPPTTARSFDVVVCCDCIYNEALVEPLVSTTADLARLRVRAQQEDQDQDDDNPSSSSSFSSTARSEPCVCIVAQQLRSPDVFEEWIGAFHRDFRTWRVPDALLPEGLRIEAGFVVHVGILREAEVDF